MAITIRGLWKLLHFAVVLCDAIDEFGPNIRKFVPVAQQDDYDAALTQIKAACDVLRAISYLDDYPGTNPPWGY